MTPTAEQEPSVSMVERLSDEAFARDLRELRLWLEGAEPVHGHQGWQHRTLNFYWMDKFRTVAKEAEARLASPTDTQR